MTAKCRCKNLHLWVNSFHLRQCSTSNYRPTLNKKSRWPLPNAIRSSRAKAPLLKRPLAAWTKRCPALRPFDSGTTTGSVLKSWQWSSILMPCQGSRQIRPSKSILRWVTMPSPKKRANHGIVSFLRRWPDSFPYFCGSGPSFASLDTVFR